MSELEGLPALPDGWVWEATVDAIELTVSIRNEGFTLAKRHIRGVDPHHWEDKILSIAKVMWEDMNRAAKLSAKLGILVVYE